ncbi:MULTISPECIES: hypothetical protein [unclassified Sphingomonas]|uniref:hypothetical protein n=1 Tax=unclassified Sphingomonas TaxID=196159 RepID=UPI000E10CDCD|nr:MULTISPECIES: hypothetical protein [unclassified Sphingomonas]AXJ94353.1 hypothetical protein DM480_01445 [Sphingomonas sp. FARSPH]
MNAPLRGFCVGFAIGAAMVLLHATIGAGEMSAKPISFWMYVLAGAMMIIASTIAMPFLGPRKSERA